MSSYSTPSTSNSSVFNTSDYTWANATLKYSTADKRYLLNSNVAFSGMLSNIASIQSANTTIFTRLALATGGSTETILALQNANTASNIAITALQNANNTTNVAISSLNANVTTINTKTQNLESSSSNTIIRSQLHISGNILSTSQANTGVYMGFDPSASNSNPLIQLVSSGNVSGNLSAINFMHTNSTYSGRIEFNHSQNAFRFYRGTTQILVIDGFGNFRIGTGNPTQALDVTQGDINTNTNYRQNGNIVINSTTFSNIQANTTALQTATTFITASTLTGNTTVSGNVVLSGNLVAGSNYFSVANGAVMIGTVNPTSTGASCPLLVQSSTTSNNPWLNGICCYGNLTANAVITASVQNSGLNCWFALANRFGNSWVIANDNGTNSGNPLRWQASQDFSNVNANMMSLTRTGNLWVNRAIGIGNASPIAPLYVTAGGSGTDPSTNGLLVANMNTVSGNNAIITCRTNGVSGGSPMFSLDVFNVAGWSILNSNTLNNALCFNAAWDGSGTNHLTILRNTGNVGIATTNPAHRLTVGGTMGVFPTNNFTTERLRLYSDASGTADIIQIRQTIGSSATYWYYNGNNVAGTVSDRRVKCNISDLNIDESIAFIKKLRPRKFNYKSNPDGDIQVGFIAQEVLESCVNLEQKSTIANYETYCDDNPDCPSIGLNQTQLQPMMIHTIQNLLNTVETLKSRIVDLEKQKKN